MAINYTIDAAAGVIHSRFEGELTLELVKEYSTRLRGDPAFHPGLDELAVVLPDHVANLSAGEMEVFANWFRQLVPIRRIAVLAQSEAGFGMARMFQQLLDASETKVGVFRELARARKWLGLPEDPE